MMNLLIGFFLAAIIAILAWRAGSLNRSGAWAAALSGGLIFGLGGFPWAVLLLTFFISSSGLSRAFSRRKADLSEKFSKGGRRDWAQVLANGGLGALLVLIHAWQPQAAWTWIAFVGAMAAVNADTWATEIGVLSRTAPRLITNGKVVERGASGGVSLLGSLAALGGAGLIVIFAALVQPQGVWSGIYSWIVLVAGLLGGMSGAFFDSFLGATVQAIYYCPACQKETERYPQHLCGEQTRPLRGWRWLDNDLVNFAAALLGASLAAGVWSLLSAF
jgi:uncharacterized protein (TIGR00297 family)